LTEASITSLSIFCEKEWIIIHYDRQYVIEDQISQLKIEEKEKKQD
jgi:hypothetical protein